MAKVDRRKQRKKRQRRIRKKIYGTSDKPRMCIYKSLRHIYVQVIDDTKGETLTSASTLDTEFNGAGCTIKSARKLGKLVATRAKDLGLKEVIFDRSGYPYHGIVKALAETARKEGLKF